MTYYVGDLGENSALGPSNERYFYAIRVDDDGNLYFTRVDLWVDTGQIEINKAGPLDDNWDFFELGTDFFEGKDPVTRERPYPNLNYDQYRFGPRSAYYYLDSNGDLIVRYNQTYDYPTDV